MERRRLGGTDLELSVIGLGTWVFGGRWGGAEDEASLAACHAALDAGVNWIDTADIYGQGRAAPASPEDPRAEPDDAQLEVGPAQPPALHARPLPPCSRR